jgi:hypothetical protein
MRRACQSRDDVARLRAPDDEFLEPDQADATCPVLLPKIFRFAFGPNQIHKPRRPVSTRGAFRDRHGRRKRDAMDAVAPEDEGCSPRTAKPCGPDAPTLASSFAESSVKRWWQKSPVTRESPEETVKTIRVRECRVKPVRPW